MRLGITDGTDDGVSDGFNDGNEDGFNDGRDEGSKDGFDVDDGWLLASFVRHTGKPTYPSASKTQLGLVLVS